MKFRYSNPNIQIGNLPHPLSEMGTTACSLNDVMTEKDLEIAVLVVKVLETMGRHFPYQLCKNCVRHGLFSTEVMND